MELKEINSELETIKSCAISFIEQFSVSGHAESYCTANLLFSYASATLHIGAVYFMFVRNHTYTMEAYDFFSSDDEQEQKQVDKFFFNVNKDMSFCTKKLMIPALRYYQKALRRPCDDGDFELIKMCDDFIRLIDEYIDCIQEFNFPNLL